jgi:hypothetical protein
VLTQDEARRIVGEYRQAAWPNFEGWTFDSVGKRCKCWVSAFAVDAVDFVVLNDLEVWRALS